jgi:ubiquinone/menaquinone biosynthesis C-methylase UbiE
MNPDFQRRIQRYGWDAAASHYDASWQSQLRPAQRRLLDVANLKPGERVVDIACGTGLVTLPAADAVGTEGEVLAVDLSDDMVSMLQARLDQGPYEHVRVARMDAEALGIPNGSFDAALCSLGLMYVPNPEQAAREMHRVLAEGGRAVAVVWGRRDQCGWAEIFPIVDRRVSSDVCPLFFQLGTADTLEQTFQQAGFQVDSSERFNVDLHFKSPDAACDAAFWGGAVALAWRKFDEPTRKAARSEYLDSIEQFRDGDGYAIPGEFVVVAGRRTGVTAAA